MKSRPLKPINHANAENIAPADAEPIQGKENLAPKKKKTRTRAKLENKSWSKKSGKKKLAAEDKPNNILATRTDNRADVKTHFLLMPKAYPPFLNPDGREAMDKELHAEFAAKVPTYRPRKPIPGFDAPATPNKPTDSSMVLTPPEVFTPEFKTRLGLDGSIGNGRTYSNRFLDNLTRTDTVTLAEVAKNSAAYDVINTIRLVTTAIKYQSVTVTPQHFARVREELFANNHARLVSQHSVMKGSANEYGEATQIYTLKMKGEINVTRMEWLHLIPYAVLGAESQTVENLVCQNKNVNTWMMLAEKKLPYLAKLYPEGFKLEVETALSFIKVDDKLVPTHNPQSFIKWRVTTKDFTLPLDFDIQRTQLPPHIDFATYVDLYVEKFVEKCQAHAKAYEATKAWIAPISAATAPTSLFNGKSAAKSEEQVALKPNKRKLDL